MAMLWVMNRTAFVLIVPVIALIALQRNACAQEDAGVGVLSAAAAGAHQIIDQYAQSKQAEIADLERKLRSSDPAERASALMDNAHAEFLAGKLPEAERDYSDAFVLIGRNGDFPGVAGADEPRRLYLSATRLDALGSIRLVLGKRDLARTDFLDALTLLQHAIRSSGPAMSAEAGDLIAEEVVRASDGLALTLRRPTRRPHLDGAETRP